MKGNILRDKRNYDREQKDKITEKKRRKEKKRLTEIKQSKRKLS